MKGGAIWIIAMIKFLKDERGDVVLLVYLIMIFCILGVLAFDYSRAHAIHARLMTAADAAALAAAMEAEIITEYKYKMYDADGNVTDDPNKAVKVRTEVIGHYADLQTRQWQANSAAREAFKKNIMGHKMPVKDVALPILYASPGNVASGKYYATGSIRFDRPKYTEKGRVYYDEYKFEAIVGVRTFLLAGPLGRWLVEAVEKDSTLPKEWQGVIPVRVKGTAQALPPKMEN